MSRSRCLTSVAASLLSSSTNDIPPSDKERSSFVSVLSAKSEAGLELASIPEIPSATERPHQARGASVCAAPGAR